MNSDLHDLLDRPLPGEPTLRPPAETVAATRRGLHRRRVAATGLVAAAAVAVGGVALGATGTGDTSAGPASSTDPTSSRPPFSVEDRGPSLDGTWLRARYPAAAALADCLVERGYPVRVGLYGGISFESTSATVEEYTLDVQGCQAELRAARRETRDAPASER